MIPASSQGLARQAELDLIQPKRALSKPAKVPDGSTQCPPREGVRLAATCDDSRRSPGRPPSRLLGRPPHDIVAHIRLDQRHLNAYYSLLVPQDEKEFSP